MSEAQTTASLDDLRDFFGGCGYFVADLRVRYRLGSVDSFVALPKRPGSLNVEASGALLVRPYGVKGVVRITFLEYTPNLKVPRGIVRAILSSYTNVRFRRSPFNKGRGKATARLWTHFVRQEQFVEIARLADVCRPYPRRPGLERLLARRR